MEGILSPPLLFLMTLLFTATIRAVTGSGPSTTALFILGDSTVNCGDNAFFYPLLPPNSSSTRCIGSRHRLLPDLIAEKMGLPPVPPFYGGNWTVGGLAAGVNFGSTPATILSTDGGGDKMFLFQSLSQQVRQASETLQLLYLEMGPAAARHVASSSLFLLSFGQDDYVGLFSNGGDPAVGMKYGRRGLARLLVSQMIRAVKDLYNADIRRIACIGVGPLGCAPRIVSEAMQAAMALERRRGDGYCVDEVNEIVSAYNAMLSTALLRLNSELPGLQIVFCDIYQGILEILSNPLAYGFKNVRDACCGLGRHGGMIGCLTQEMACSDPSGHVWWDLYSPTEAANMLLANWSWSLSLAQPRICSPTSLRQLASSSSFST